MTRSRWMGACGLALAVSFLTPALFAGPRDAQAARDRELLKGDQEQVRLEAEGRVTAAQERLVLASSQDAGKESSLTRRAQRELAKAERALQEGDARAALKFTRRAERLLPEKEVQQ